MIRHSSCSPIIADPAVLAPEHTPDGSWRLFAHSAWGIHQYTSRDGESWRDLGLVIRDAMRPWVLQEDGQWFLLYERYRPLGLALSWMHRRIWRSRIEMRRSRDLRFWDPPATLLEPCLAWHSRAGLGEAVGDPCLVKAGSRYLLYYSASLVRIPDCGFNEPESIGLAEAERIQGPYEPRREPILVPEAADPWANLSRGSLRLLRLEDGWAGFENGIYIDDRTRVSGSAILLLCSHDAVSWDRLTPTPLLAPGAGWMRSHVYACCPVERRPGEIWLYFNARDDWPLSRGKECIGRIIGSPGKGTA
jgi:hypothetical protein